MGQLKSAMMDIGYTVLESYNIENGIAHAVQKYSMPEEDVKMCVLLVEAYDGPWEDYLQEATALRPKLH